MMWLSPRKIPCVLLPIFGHSVPRLWAYVLRSTKKMAPPIPHWNQQGLISYILMNHSTVTMGLSRTISKINGNFGWKSQIFSSPIPFIYAPVEGVPLKFCNGAGDAPARWLEKLDTMFFHLDTIPVFYRQMDGWNW